MNQIDQIIDGLVEKLKDGGLAASYLIAAFPNKPDEFDMSGARIALLVQYVGSRYSGALSGGSQQRQANFALHLSILNASEANPNDEIAAIYSIVQGVRVCGCELTVVRDAFVDITADARKFVIEISTQFPTVPGAHPVPSPFIENYTQTEAS